MTAYLALLALVALERGVELALSRRHARAVRARGAVEAGAGHFPVMVGLHALFLPCCAAEVLLLDRPFIPPLAAVMLLFVLGAQALRYAVVRTLGDRWNVRVLVVPGEPPVTAGLYRRLRHPNYVAVVVEAFALPLVHTAWVTALVFTAGNLLLLGLVRIPVEEAALRSAAAAADAGTGRRDGR